MAATLSTERSKLRKVRFPSGIGHFCPGSWTTLPAGPRTNEWLGGGRVIASARMKDDPPQLLHPSSFCLHPFPLRAVAGIHLAGDVLVGFAEEAELYCSEVGDVENLIWDDA